MPTEIVRLRGYDGPNLYGPQTSVVLQVRSEKDLSKRIKNILKDGAQNIGMIIGYLDVETEQQNEDFLITAHYVTPTPSIGVELARYVVDGMNAKEVGDEEWDPEEPLWDLKQRLRAETLPIQALQLCAEANTRNIPSFVRADGRLQIGYGVRGKQFDIASFKERLSSGSFSVDDIGLGAPPSARSAAAVDVPWQQLGLVPLVAVSGDRSRDQTARFIAGLLQSQGYAVALTESADFAATHAALGEPHAALVVAGLAVEDLIVRGVAFERCSYSAIVDVPEKLPAEIRSFEELTQVLGIPMLVTNAEGRVVLNADVPEIVALAEYAPCPVIYFTTRETNTIVGIHRAHGGEALFVRDQTVFATHGASEQPVARASLPDVELPGALASIALSWAMGFSWDQILAMMEN
ncbi:MAG: DUF4938 domain-containing protein [Chloroflexi bacterium AL-W]|nr:DUF4938 domain-containing protein [Chloroflexi bacterium AL-N1]NOK64842.1 DUF4938 domain-containing protein [Chloroflexi bacterium AL-N10]NOK76612.1 DUF4938 domain-containing protein [Chloroflexi bacterium AL-N5]NOK80159.1 DUF4938 domain-containing protein [Chloroflexi bacterium AL-W]NOK86672.1 DUF4938 domain-containing protein [Chloroflexi bacterium AL-N15]